MTTCVIRLEQKEDRGEIKHLHEAAFGRRFEASLVDVLRRNARPYLGLVAISKDGLIGHLLFTPVHCESQPEARLLGLAPMAVLPPFQRQGIGTRLLRGGLSAARDTGARAALVLGDPAFYGRFGFTPAAAHGLHCAWEVPADAFMVQPLNAPGLDGLNGLISYHGAFDGEGIATTV